jgi:hypothetical protein
MIIMVSDAVLSIAGNDGVLEAKYAPLDSFRKCRGLYAFLTLEDVPWRVRCSRSLLTVDGRFVIRVMLKPGGFVWRYDDGASKPFESVRGSMDCIGRPRVDKYSNSIQLDDYVVTRSTSGFRGDYAKENLGVVTQIIVFS